LNVQSKHRTLASHLVNKSISPGAYILLNHAWLSLELHSPTRGLLGAQPSPELPSSWSLLSPEFSLLGAPLSLEPSLPGAWLSPEPLELGSPMRDLRGARASYEKRGGNRAKGSELTRSHQSFGWRLNLTKKLAKK